MGFFSETRKHTCSRCHWPLCSDKCEDSALHEPECRLIRYGGSKVQIDSYGQYNMMYACITVLRALSLKEGPSKVWEDYTRFEFEFGAARRQFAVYAKSLHMFDWNMIIAGLTRTLSRG